MHSAPCMRPIQNLLYVHALVCALRSTPALHRPRCSARASLITAPALHPLRTPVAAGVVHLVMELCNGPTLQWVLDKRGALSEPETRSIMRQLVEAVVHLHARRLKSSLPCSLSG